MKNLLNMSDASFPLFRPDNILVNLDAFSFRTFVPTEPSSPVEFYDDVNAFRVAAVNKNHVPKLPAEWDSPAVYVLLGDRDTAGGWDVYVGKAPSGVKARLRQHVRGKDNWSRALVILRDTTLGMNSAQIGWLEGRLWEMFTGEYPSARVANTVQPGDKTLLAHDHLEGAVATIRNVLRVLGYESRHTPVVKKRETDNGKEKKTPMAHQGSVSDLVASGVLSAGTKLMSTAPKYPAVAVIGPNGEIVVGEKTFGSPSAAGGHVRGGKATNGWDFWAVKQPDGSLRRLAEYRDEYGKRNS